MERLEQVGPFAGTQFLVGVYQKGEKTIVLYQSNHGEGRSALWKTTQEPFEQDKTEKVADGGISGIVEAGDKFYVLLNGVINKLNLDLNRVDPISTSFTFRRNLFRRVQPDV